MIPSPSTAACLRYPATLILAADQDDRVVPSHAYKFAAALQAAQGCGRPTLLRVATSASHGYSSKAAEIAELADMWTFVAASLGVRGIPRAAAGKQPWTPAPRDGGE